MQINYYSSRNCIFPFHIPNRHFQVAFTSNDPRNLAQLWRNEVIQDPSQPISLLGRVKHLILGVLEYITFPLVGMLIALFDRYFNYVDRSNIDPKVYQTILKTSSFNSYAFENDQNVHLTDIGMRPANLFYKALFDGKDPTTQPGQPKLFQFPKPLSKIHQLIFQKPDSQVIQVKAIGEKKVDFYQRNDFGILPCGSEKLESFLGTNTYKLSIKEIKEMLNSQRIYISPLIPKEFYLEVKKAMDLDNTVILPGTDNKPVIMHEILSSNDASHLHTILKKVQNDPKKYGFINNGVMLSFDQVLSLTLYQVGSMIVKTEDYRCFLGEGYRIAKREVGDKDAIRLISASGIRGFFATSSIPNNDKHQIDHKIMKHTFKMALQSLGKEAYFVVPAVGMGVWRGDPDIYWRAFLDAVIEGGNNLENILINPRHQKTRFGKYEGYTGEEFGIILAEYINTYPSNHNLKKIINLFDHKTDLLLLAKNLKEAFPEKTIGLVNASDPDVTWGNHVGEYVLHICHASTTEENFAAAGTSGLGFEGISRVREHPDRIIQCR